MVIIQKCLHVAHQSGILGSYNQTSDQVGVVCHLSCEFLSYSMQFIHLNTIMSQALSGAHDVVLTFAVPHMCLNTKVSRTRVKEGHTAGAYLINVRPSTLLC